MGGCNTSDCLSLINDVFYTPDSSSGVGTWSSTTNYPLGIYDQSCVTVAGDIYCVGGVIIEELGGIIPIPYQVYTHEVYYAPVSSSGVGAWSSTTNYPLGVTAESCAVAGGYIYCVGGEIGSGYTNNVYYAPVSSSGVGAWSPTTNYPLSMAAQSCVVSGGEIYCVGGSASSGYTNNVYYTPVSSSGVGAWSPTTNYPLSVQGQPCAASGGYIYCVGGEIGSGYIGGIYFATYLITTTTSSTTSLQTITTTIYSTTTTTALATTTTTTTVTTPITTTASTTITNAAPATYTTTYTTTQTQTMTSPTTYTTTITAPSTTYPTAVIIPVGMTVTSTMTVTITAPTTSTTAPVGPLTISCGHTSTVVGVGIRCYAIVNASVLAPTGSITWSSSSSGKFSSTSCKLTRHLSFSACLVGFIPTVVGSPIVLTAKYAGDSNNSASVGTYNLRVLPKATVTVVSCKPASVVAGSSKVIKCTANVKGYSQTGTVTWSSTGTGAVSLPAGATCTLTKRSCSVTFTGTSGGTITIQAIYAGDSNNLKSSRTTVLTITS